MRLRKVEEVGLYLLSNQMITNFIQFLSKATSLAKKQQRQRLQKKQFSAKQQQIVFLFSISDFEHSIRFDSNSTWQKREEILLKPSWATFEFVDATNLVRFNRKDCRTRGQYVKNH